MKHTIYGIAAAALAMSASLPAMANSAPAVQVQPPAMETQTITRTIVVSETPIYGQQIVAALDERGDASNFRNLVAVNGLPASLRDDEDGYTAFVPVDRAFEGASIQIPATANPNGTIDPQARAVLEQHITDSKYDINLLHGTRDSVTTLSGDKITISKMGQNYYANGHLIVDRWHDPEGIIYFIESFVSSPEFNSAVYNPADVKK